MTNTFTSNKMLKTKHLNFRFQIWHQISCQQLSHFSESSLVESTSRLEASHITAFTVIVAYNHTSFVVRIAFTRFYHFNLDLKSLQSCENAYTDLKLTWGQQWENLICLTCHIQNRKMIPHRIIRINFFFSQRIFVLQFYS